MVKRGKNGRAEFFSLTPWRCSVGGREARLVEASDAGTVLCSGPFAVFVTLVQSLAANIAACSDIAKLIRVNVPRIGQR